MNRYLEIARSVPDTRSSENTAGVVGTQGATHNEPGPEELKLETAGWKPKRRGERTIWESPDRRGWYSQEMALHLLQRKPVEP